MRFASVLTLTALLCLHTSGQGQAPDDAAKIIDKAVKVMGLDKLPKTIQGAQTKSKGTLEIMGMTLNFTQSVLTRMPNQFRDAMELQVGGMTVSVRTVYDGKMGWVEVGGQIKKLDDKTTAELKDIASLLAIGRMTPLLDKDKYTLTIIGESKVNGQAAQGIRVAPKEGKEFSIYFDKKTGVMSKLERQSLDAMTGKEVHEERIISEYKDKDGRKVPHKIEVHRDGKKAVDAEIIEYSFLEKVDPGEFKMPQ